jgi:AraC-like DNA-binding protein
LIDPNMTLQTLQILSLILIVVCTIMALVFIAIPLPNHEGLREYKNSLKILALSFITVAFCTAAMETDFFSSVFIATSYTQLILFTLSLIVLINPKKIKIRYVLKSSTPLIFFVLINIVLNYYLQTPEIANWQDLKLNITHPTIVFRALFLLSYIAQLIYSILLFKNEFSHFNVKLNNFFTDDFKPRLKWIKISFYSSVLIGVVVIFATLLPSLTFNILFEIGTILFYVGFGLLFIQYPRFYPKIKSILSEQIHPVKSNNSITWSMAKESIIAHQLHIKQGVTIEDVAKHLKTSRNSISALINREAGVNFNSWINELRINDAKQIMCEDPSLPIAQISEMVGFSEPSNFSKQFKLVTQHSPKQWRQKNLN